MKKKNNVYGIIGVGVKMPIIMQGLIDTLREQQKVNYTLLLNV